MCRPGPLDNRLRRWAAPPSRDLDALDILPGMHVVDLGAGVGYFATEVLRRLGPTGRLDLVDIDGENLAIARSRLGDDARVGFHIGSAATVPALPDADYDRVLLSLVLCCLADKDGAMETAWRLLRPGGRALVTFPRGALPSRRGRVVLRVTRARWRSLLARRPWLVRPTRRGWAVHRFLLEKPARPAGAAPNDAVAGGAATVHP